MSGASRAALPVRDLERRDGRLGLVNPGTAEPTRLRATGESTPELAPGPSGPAGSAAG